MIKERINEIDYALQKGAEAAVKIGKELIIFYIDKISTKKIISDFHSHIKIGLNSSLDFRTEAYLENKK